MLLYGEQDCAEALLHQRIGELRATCCIDSHLLYNNWSSWGCLCPQRSQWYVSVPHMHRPGILQPVVSARAVRVPAYLLRSKIWDSCLYQWQIALWVEPTHKILDLKLHPHSSVMKPLTRWDWLYKDRKA